MRGMFGGSYAKAVRRSFLPEWLSMNMVMAGMVPVMVALMSHATGAMEPSSIRFWGVMSLAIMGVIAYPVDVWLVAAGLKHGMGSVRALGGGIVLADLSGGLGIGSTHMAAVPASH